MIELKNLHDRYLMHQAFVAAAAAAAAAAINFNNTSSTDNLDTSSTTNAMISAFIQLHNQQLSQNSNEDLATSLNSYSNNSSTSLFQSSSSSSSPHSPKKRLNDENETYLEINNDYDIQHNLLNKRPVDDHDLNCSIKRFKSDESNIKRKLSDLPYDDDTNEFTPANNKKFQNKKSSSFLISDILGLESESPKKQDHSKCDNKLIQQSYYSAFANLNSANEFYRMLSTNTTSTASTNLMNDNKNIKRNHETTPAVSPILAVSSTPISTINTITTTPITNKPALSPVSHKSELSSKPKNSILSSLEQLTKNQFQDEISIKTKCLINQPKTLVKNDSSKKFESESMSDNKNSDKNDSNKNHKAAQNANALPAWVFCTRYSDRPSAGPRNRKKSKTKNVTLSNNIKVKSECTQQQHNQSNHYQQQGLSSSIKGDSSKTNTNLSYSSSSSNSSFSYSPSLTTTTTTTTTTTNKLIKSDTEIKSEFTISNDTNLDNNDERNPDYDDDDDEDDDDSNSSSSKRPRTAFTNSQLQRLKNEFEKCKYLTGEKRQYLANELNLNESQIKIWFQNKRAKIKKSSGIKNNLALQLMAQGLYNHGSSSCSNNSIHDD